MQWAVEQEEAGGEVNFKEGLAFYSSIGILQVSGRRESHVWRVGVTKVRRAHFSIFAAVSLIQRHGPGVGAGHR